jgi:homoserine/homoserine lactone efflux protein
MSLHTWLAFFTACWIISLAPGPGALSCMAVGQRVGYRRALWNILGLQLGLLFMVAIVAAGLGALLAASQHLFLTIKWVGAVYLVWLGIQQWRAPVAPVSEVSAEVAEGRWALVLRAFLINITNPKGVLFLLAVLPQFIDPHAPQAIQYLLCALSLVFTDIVVMNGYTLLAARVLRLLREPHHIRWMNRGFGSLFVGAGVLLAGFKR